MQDIQTSIIPLINIPVVYITVLGILLQVLGASHLRAFDASF
jgi:hypothetical protein